MVPRCRLCVRLVPGGDGVVQVGLSSACAGHASPARQVPTHTQSLALKVEGCRQVAAGVSSLRLLPIDAIHAEMTHAAAFEEVDREAVAHRVRRQLPIGEPGLLCPLAKHQLHSARA
jgi:hypothetical protein